MKRPLPVEFGFALEAEVYGAEEREGKRKAKLAWIRWGTLLVFLFVAGALLVTFLDPVSLVPTFLRGRSDLSAIVLLVFLALPISISVVVGWLLSWGSQAIAERFLPSSEEYSRARAYLEALQWWRRRVKEDYGYP
jgi:hypothetical protein